jgi:tRNA(fMet)-specific endonuclease VapC
LAYLIDTPTLAEVLRTTPSRTFVRRLSGVSTRDRWTSVVSVGQLLIAARRTQQPRLMQDVVNLVAGVRVAPFDLPAAQAFAKLRVASTSALDTDDLMMAATALSLGFGLVTRRPAPFSAIPGLRVEDWVGR